MAENDVGGIGVKFTADAAQLKQELQNLEQRLRSFNQAHGQTKVKLQASLTMPGNRVLQDFRRDLEKSFQAQGAAGQIRARVTLLPPTQTDIKAMSAKIGDVKVKVVGSFEWAAGKQPPKTVTVKVVEQVETRGSRSIVQTQATAQAASGRKPTHDEIQRSREEYRRQERLAREGGGAQGFAFGGARGFAAGGGGDDPYRQNELRDQRARMHDVQKAKADANDARHQAAVERSDRARRARLENQPPDERQARYFEQNAEYAKPESLGPGGTLPFGNYYAPTHAAVLPERAAVGRRRRATMAQLGATQLPLFAAETPPSALSVPPPVAGYAPGVIGARHEVRAVMTGSRLTPAMDEIHGEGGDTPLGAQFNRNMYASTWGGPRRTAVPPAPPFIHPAIRQQAAGSIAAEPTLQEQQENLPAGAGGGGGGRRRPPAGAGAGDDEVGQPRPGGRVAEMLNIIEQGKFAVQGARQAGQVRAVGTTVASQLGGLLGRGVDVVKVNEMTAVLSKMKTVVLDNADAFEELAEKTAEFGAGSKEVAGLEKQLEGPRKQFEALNKQLDELQPNKFGQMATGLASSIAGTIIGLGLFNAVTQGLSVAGDAIGEVIERQTGYNNIANKTVGALSDQTRALAGWVEGAIAAQSATTGMSDAMAEFVQQNLDARVAGEAANKNIQQQNELFQSALAIRRQTGQANLPPGVDVSALGTTGGLNILGLQTPLFGTPSAQELMGRQLGGERFADISTFNPASFGQQVLSGNLFGAAGAAQTKLGVPALTGAPRSPLTTAGTAGGGNIVQGLVSAVAGFINPQAAAEAQNEAPVLTLEGVDPQQIRDFVDTVDLMNEALGRAGDEGLRFKGNVEDLTAAQAKQGQVEAKRQADLAREGGAGFLANAIQQGGGRLLLQGLTGNRAQQIQQIQQSAAQYQRGALMPNREAAAFGQTRQISAQLQLQRAQGQLQRESIIPGQSFLSQLFAGRAPGGAQGGVNIPPVSRGTAGLPPGVLSQPGIDTSQLSAGLGQVEAQANKGRDALVGMIKSADQINRTAGVPSNLLQQFNSLTEAAGKTAATIRSISQASAWAQVNLQVKQINEQIFLMSRSLEDARSFLSGTGTGELGLLQNRARSLDIAQAELGFRQQSLGLANQELGIQASTLQLQQRQRQINFQRAIAGFVTPGQTPEEIAARQREAGLEADFAQKQQNIGVTQLENQKESVALAREQLGISKEQFAVQQAMIQVSAERAVGDLGRAIGLLQEQAHVTVQLQVNSEAIAAYQEVLEAQKAQIESVITEAYNTQQTILTNSAALVATYGGKITEWNNMLIRALSEYIAGASAAIAGFKPTYGQYAPQSGVTGPSGGGGGGGGANTNATGFYGNVSGKTSMVVGEAGPETIAILRNPRGMTWGGNGGNGGGVNINVMVSGNNVNSEEQAQALAYEIARKVEETMSRRSSLLGLRAN